MNCNIGKFDRVLRRSLGLIIIGLGFYYKSWFGLIGLIPIGFSYWNYCPLYTAFKINTNKGEEENVGIN
jgi:hypothetical protein